MTFASCEIGPTFFLLPSKVKVANEQWDHYGPKKCGSDGTTSRWMVENGVITGRHRPIVWGDVDDVVKELKDRWQICKDDHPAWKGIHSCYSCANSCGNPVVHVEFQDAVHPKLTVTIRQCYRYGSRRDISYPIFAMSGKVQDLFGLLQRAKFGRFLIHASPLELLGRDYGNEKSTPGVQELLSANNNENHQNVTAKNNTSKKDPIASLVDAYMDLQVIEFGYEFKLYKSTAWFLHRVLATDRAKVEHIGLAYHASNGVDPKELDDSIKILADAFRNNRSLKSISLDRCGFSDAAIAVLVDGMKYNPNLIKLNLTGNGCRDETVTALGRLLAHPTCSLKLLNLSDLLPPRGADTDDNSAFNRNRKPDDGDVLDLTPLACPGLETNHSLEHVRFVGAPPFKEAGIEAMINVIKKKKKKNSNKHDDHHSNKDGGEHDENDNDENTNTAKTSKLKRIVLHRVKGLTPTACKLFLQVPDVKQLFLSCCELSGEALKTIGETLKFHSNDVAVEHLDLSGNMFGGTGNCTGPDNDMKVFSEGIVASTSLRHLDLSNSDLGDDDLVSFSRFVPSMKSLISLNLDMNEFDVIGATSLLNGLRQNNTLRGLGVATYSGCSLGGPMPKYVYRFLDEYGDMEYYLSLNRCGRVLLEKTDAIPSGLWPLILGKLATERKLFPIPDVESHFVGGADDDENDNENDNHRRFTPSEAYVHDAIFCLLKGHVLVR